MKFKYIPILFLLVLLAGCNHSPNSQFKEITSPAGDNSMYPRLFTDNTGAVFLSWVEENGNLAELKYATFDNDSWSSATTLSSDSTWFLNWADYPSLIAHDGKPLATHWLNKVKGGTYAYHINMATYNNGWSEAFTPHKDDTPTEHGFVSMTPATDSTFLAVWLDGRNTDGRGHDEYMDMNMAMSLRGAIIGNDSEIKDKFLLDDSVCDCCNTSVIKTDKGFIAAYRNRTDEEIRDIYVTSFANGSWTDPKPVHNDNWNIAACPVNGPAIDAYDNNIAVAWFTGANGEAKVKLAVSKDYGETFGPPVTLDDGNPYGRVDLNMSENKIWVSWLTSAENDAELQIRSFTFDGVEIASYSLPGLSNSRNSGFPHISVWNEGLLIAYTDVSGESPHVRTLLLE
ncbi:MAG TPA: hypothetical protein VFM80_12020 [Gracilimonas sp.]|uniref:hypothetical protein n=1 Tax=Gracilimonas sp. TaxID=1974203 RepID=UPI002DA52D74|nr:hypothetical protein [Gracilimonas sp.]